jgi:GNAT superfamily N-acetyltransferase
LRIFLSRVLARAGYQHRLFLECPLKENGLTASPTASVDVRELEASDAESFVTFRRGPDIGLFLERIRDGQCCFAAFVDTELASVTWAVQGTATLWAINADFDVDNDVVYVFDSYTHPDFRGKRLQAAIFQQIGRAYVDNGVREAVTFVAATNSANLRSRGRLGFTVSGAVRRFRIGPLVWYLSTGNAPELRRHV